MKAFITGARGFLGSNLTAYLKTIGIPYVRYDALDGCHLHRWDYLQAAMEECDTVFHLAANADIQKGWDNPTRDLEVNTIGTSQVLEAMRTMDKKRIIFASSSAVYGETVNPKEDCPWPIQTSLYGASKVAGEALIQAYAEGKGFEAYICRLSLLLGEGYKHGHVYDFVKQLETHPEYLTVRGDGKQRKAYIYVKDCISAMLSLSSEKRTGIWNLVTTESCTIRESIGWIYDEMKVLPVVSYSGGDKGWVGDAPNLTPSCEKLYATGWRPTVNTEEAIRRTVRSIIKNEQNECAGFGG